jgi:DNA-binding winged helix-turn-helix (wHTH) protein
MEFNVAAGTFTEMHAENILAMLDKGHFRFDVFDVDVQRGELWKSGSMIKLQDKPFQLLVLLLERAGKTASHDELGRELWPENADANFGDSLKTAVSKLRQVLGDPANRPVFIKTVHLRGYRFVAPVVNLGEEYVPSEIRQVPGTTNSRSSRGAVDDVIGVRRLSWARRLLGMLVAVAIIVAVLYAFRRNNLRVSRPSAQSVPLVILPFGSFSGDPKYAHCSEIFKAENTALLSREFLKYVPRSLRASEIRREAFSRFSGLRQGLPIRAKV